MLGMINYGCGPAGVERHRIWAKGTQYRSMRALFPMVRHAISVRGPGNVRTLGRSAHLPESGSATVRKQAPAAPISPRSSRPSTSPAVLRNGAWEDLVSQLGSGELDGMAFAVGAPIARRGGAGCKEPLDFFQLSPEQVALVRTRFPELTPSLIPSGTYPSLHEDYHTVGLYNFAVIHRDVSRRSLFIELSKRSSSISRNSSAPIPPQRNRPGQPRPGHVLAARTPEPRAIIVRSGSPSHPPSNRPLDAALVREVAHEAAPVGIGLPGAYLVRSEHGAGEPAVGQNPSPSVTASPGGTYYVYGQALADIT